VLNFELAVILKRIIEILHMYINKLMYIGIYRQNIHKNIS